MSEGLQSKYLKDGKIVGQKIIEFEYFNIGDVTLNQLNKAKLIPNAFSKEYNSLLLLLEFLINAGLFNDFCQEHNPTSI